MSLALSPVLWHYFAHPLPYGLTLALQERIHKLQLHQRHTSGSHKDVLLLLQHRPVYTAGRRQTEDSISAERARLNRLGADFVSTTRGGQLTYHGPGQLVGYPLLDLGRPPPLSVRTYVARLQAALAAHLRTRHRLAGLAPCAPERMGVFVDGGATKLASIGVQVRHRLTAHGFALNVTREPLPWFSRIVACGLRDVRAGCIEDAVSAASDTAAAAGPISVEDEVPALVATFGKMFEREMSRMNLGMEGEIGEAIQELEEHARLQGPWNTTPIEQSDAL